MKENSIEVVYEEEVAVQFLKAEAMYKDCIENPNNKNCLNNLFEIAEKGNSWARVRYIDVQLQGLISDEAMKIKKPKKKLKEMAQNHFYFAQLKWAQYILSDEKSNHKKCKKAVEKLMELTDEKIYCSDAHYYLGLFYMNKGKDLRARKHFNKAIKCGNKYAKSKLADIDKHVNMQKVKAKKSINELISEIKKI